MITGNFLSDVEPSQRVLLLESFPQLKALPTSLVNMIDHYIGPIIKPNANESVGLWKQEIEHYESKVITLIDSPDIGCFFSNRYFKLAKPAHWNTFQEVFSKIEEIILPSGWEGKKIPFFPNITVYRIDREQ